MALEPGGILYAANFDRIRSVDTGGVQANFATGYNRVVSWPTTPPCCTWAP